MSVTLTPQQLAAIHERLTATCTDVEIQRWDKAGNTVEVSQFNRRRPGGSARLIETVKIRPGGDVTVLS